MELEVGILGQGQGSIRTLAEGGVRRKEAGMPKGPRGKKLGAHPRKIL